MNPMVALSLVTSMSVGILQHHPTWTDTADTGVTARLRGLSAVSAEVAWASGSAGTVLRTVDGGESWKSVGPPDTADLQFRDIEAFDADHAVILAIGPGESSRVYITANGGNTWRETFRNTDPNAFYDCMAFFDHRHGLALSDPVDGKFRILSTSDGGGSWNVLPSDRMPAALEGEFAFAASGTCLATADFGLLSNDAWFATGGGATARVFHSRDRGRSWTAADTAIPSGPTAGIYSLAFRDPWHGIAVGGDFLTPDSAPDAAAVTRDGGRTWTLAEQEPGEYRSGVAFAAVLAIAVGPTGSDFSHNGGKTWTRFDTTSLDSVDCAQSFRPGGRGCWGSGENGRIVRLR